MQEKKYEILPGIQTPDIKSILAAASDFSKAGVEDIDVKEAATVDFNEDSMSQGTTKEELNALGDQVAYEEEKAAAESRRVMENIKKQVVAAGSINDLRKVAQEKMTDEKREAIRKEREELAAQKAEEENKARMREERRLQQQRIVEESKARKEQEALERAKKEAEEQKKLREEQARAERERARAQEDEQAKARRSEEAAKKAAKDEEYKAWVQAKRQEALEKQAASKSAQEYKQPDRKSPNSVDGTASASEEKKVELPNTSAVDDFSEFL